MRSRERRSPSTVREAGKTALQQRKEAEEMILSSGDPDAIKLLMLARENPRNYSQILAGGQKRGNSTLKTALGVMTGVVAGSMIANAMASTSAPSAWITSPTSALAIHPKTAKL